MRAPNFWWQPPSLAAGVLRPAGALYGAIAARRMRRPGRRAGLPVICVGNFTMGGAGKTPTALALAELLLAMGETPAFLTRGYGGRLRGPVLVDTARHEALDVGDEPLLLARAAPTIVAHDRPEGAHLAATQGATVIVMDDGLQNPSLAKDLSLAVVDGPTGVGNGLVVPAGPLRAPLQTQWPHVKALVIVGDGERGAALATEAERQGKSAMAARLSPNPEAAARLKGRRVLALAGIGRPEKFFATLEALGAEVVQRRPFPDHHVYSAGELAALSAEADQAGLALVTTEKDFLRIGPKTLALREIEVLPVRLVFEDAAEVSQLVARALERFRATRPPLSSDA